MSFLWGGGGDRRWNCGPPTRPRARDPPRVVGSMSDSPCQAVTISGFFSKSAKFFQTLMAPSSGEGKGQRAEGGGRAGQGRRGGWGIPIPGLTCGGEEQGAVLPIEVLHGRDACVAGVPIVEVIELLPFLPVPEATGDRWW